MRGTGGMVRDRVLATRLELPCVEFRLLRKREVAWPDRSNTVGLGSSTISRRWNICPRHPFDRARTFANAGGTIDSLARAVDNLDHFGSLSE